MQLSLKHAIEWIEARRPSRVVALTGAGISAESGIPTFRGPGGLWENHRPEELATPGAFARDPLLVWRWYEWRRGLVREARPNRAHAALAKLEDALDGRGGMTLITQNVDGLHRRAGSRAVLELHGNLFRVRCPAERTVEERMDRLDELPPKCACGSLLRPDVVWFGEMLPAGMLEQAIAAVREAELLLIVGTSGVVHPAAGLVSMLEAGEAMEINPERTPISDLARFSIQGGASEVVPIVADTIAGALR